MVAAEDWGQVSQEAEMEEHKADQVERPVFGLLGLEQRLAAAKVVEAVVLGKDLDWDWD